MFDVHCPRHGGRVLLGPRRIDALSNTPLGIVVQWRCYCGATGTERFATDRTRSRPDRETALESAA